MFQLLKTEFNLTACADVGSFVLTINKDLEVSRGCGRRHTDSRSMKAGVASSVTLDYTHLFIA